MTFWKTATTEQKLAQIDGGIECGMNAVQVAMNCGATPPQVHGVALYNGRSFGATQGRCNWGIPGAKRRSERTTVESSKRATARTGTLGDAAFSIFGDHSEAFELEWPA